MEECYKPRVVGFSLALCRGQGARRAPGTSKEDWYLESFSSDSRGELSREWSQSSSGSTVRRTSAPTLPTPSRAATSSRRCDPSRGPYPFTAMHTKRADDDGPGNRGKVHDITNENMENN